jgi:dsRNA-specific ribonuclease
MVEGQRLATGSGGSKKEAEQAAAEISIGQLQDPEGKS